MITKTAQLFTLGDLARDDRFREYSRRQIEYAIQEHDLQPAGRLGIIRAFSAEQIPQILAAVRRTARVRRL